MRITQSMLYRQTLDNMQQRETNALARQNEIASGVRLNQAMDDPAAMGRVMRNDDNALLLQRFTDNIRGLESRLGFIESELDGATDLLHRGKELMLSGANATQSTEARSALANELRSLGEAMMQVANGRDGQGRYLFAGQDDGATPFVDNGAGPVYVGSTQNRQIPIDQGASMANGRAGDAIFLNGPAGDLLSMFSELADTLEQPTPDLASTNQRNADVAAGLDRLDQALDHVLAQRSQLGVDLQRLDTARDRIEVLDIELAKDSSALRDTPLAEALADLSQEMTML